MTVYTATPQSDSNLDITLTDSDDLTVINIQPAAVSLTSAVTSVNALTGDVILNTDNVLEGNSNLYYTDARWDARLATKTTSDLLEGSNLYYTDARVDAWLQSGSVTELDFENGSGVLSWNDTDGTLDLAYDGVTLQIGQEQHLYAKATEAILDGDVVMFTGAQGNHLLIAKADMSAVGFKPEHVIGVATQAFADNQFGYVTDFGKVRDLDTSLYAEGDILYLDPTTPGAFTTTEPTPAAGHSIQIAAVTRGHQNQGTVFVKVTHMPDTDEVAEGNNLYYTDARVQTVVDNNSAGFITASSADTLTNKTGNISQWTNDAGYLTSETDSQTLSFTAPDLTISNGNSVNISAINNITSVNTQTGVVVLDTDDVAEGIGNLYYTTSRANTDFDTRLATKTTSDLSEGSNLYYTDTRANQAIDARVSGTFIEGLTYDTNGGTY